MSALESVIDNFDNKNGVFAFGRNRNTVKRRIESITPLNDTPMTVAEKRAEEQREAEEYRNEIREKFDRENKLINDVGVDVWKSSRNKFKTGDSYKMMFIEDEDESLRKTRFSSDMNIGFNKAFNQVRESRKQKEREINDVNYDLNKLERQHMEYNTTIKDRATRKTIREWKQEGNQYIDRNTDKEVGNTNKLTKLYSTHANTEILESLRDRSGPVRLFMNTTLVTDSDGDQTEREEVLSDNNFKYSDTNIVDKAVYKEELI